MSAFEPMECQNHANCGDYCETEREREMVLCGDCLDSFDQRQADLAELKTLRTANQRLEGEYSKLLESHVLDAETIHRLEGEVARLRADAGRFIALVDAKLSLDVRTLCVVVERDVYNKDDAPIVRHFQNDADQRLYATREAIDAALRGNGGAATEDCADVYTKMAASVLHVPISQVTEAQRRAVKSVYYTLHFPPAVHTTREVDGGTT